MDKVSFSVLVVITTCLLGVVFTGLKLLGYLDWSWWFIMAPFWVLIVLLVLLMVYLYVIIEISIRNDNSK